MVNFESVQSALDFIFEGKHLTAISIPNSQYPWFFVDEIRNILEFKKDNYEFTKNLNFRDQVIAILNLSNLQQIGYPTNDGVSDYLANRHPEARSFMIISEPGLYELLVRSHMPKALVFQQWLFFTVLPTLRANPQLVQQVHDLSYELDNSRSMASMYHDESIDLRKRYNKANDQINMLLAYIDAIGIPDPNPDKFRESYNAFKNHGNIEMCRKVNRFSK